MNVVNFMNSLQRRFSFVPGIRTTVALILILVITNVVAVWSILTARQEAIEIALKDLHLEAVATARSLETLLATVRGDFLFLAGTAPIRNLREILLIEDPMARRWQRLDLEASLLLYLDAHREIERIVLLDPRERPLFYAGRREGAPVLLPPPEYQRDERPGLLIGRWIIGEPNEAIGHLKAEISLDQLLNRAAATQRESYVLVRDSQPPRQTEDGILVPVNFPEWRPPIAWTLLRKPPKAGLIHSIEAIASRYRTTLILNGSLTLLLLLIGSFALLQSRKGARLEEENRQQLRIRELERQLFHSERLASVGRLAAGLAHEINNPLEGMSNYLTLLREEVGNGRPEEFAELVEQVQEGVKRISVITRQALNLANPNHEAAVRVDLNRVVVETVAFVKNHPQFRNIRVNVQEPDSEIGISANPVMLSQVFLNLLLNAAEQQPASGAIEVRIGRSQGRAVVEISDEGPGISEDQMNHIFEPFFSSKGSTGLGLSVCLGIVQRYGGQIRAENREGRGARFSVELPLQGARHERERRRASI